MIFYNSCIVMGLSIHQAREEIQTLSPEIKTRFDNYINLFCQIAQQKNKIFSHEILHKNKELLDHEQQQEKITPIQTILVHDYRISCNVTINEDATPLIKQVIGAYITKSCLQHISKTINSSIKAFLENLSNQNSSNKIGSMLFICNIGAIISLSYNIYAYKFLEQKIIQNMFVFCFIISSVDTDQLDKIAVEKTIECAYSNMNFDEKKKFAEEVYKKIKK